MPYGNGGGAMEQRLSEHGIIDPSRSPNAAWLALFYRIPRELLQRKSEYISIPRAPYEALHEEPYSLWIDSEEFIRYIQTTCAKVV